MSPPRVCVAIVTFNSRRWFVRQKAALEALSTPYDLIVIDNGSAPDQAPKAEDFPAHARIVLTGENLGFAAANNRAVELMDHPYAALLNPDAFPEPDWLAHLVETADAHPAAAAIGSTQVSADDPSRYDGLGDRYSAWGFPWRAAHNKPRDQIEARDGEVFSPCAAAALYRIDAWREVGGFDERFFCFVEDVDLGYRLRARGWTCRQAAGAIVAHVGGASAARRSAFAVFHGRRNRIWTFVKNTPTLYFALLAPAHAALALAQAILSLRSPMQAQATWRALGDAFAHMPEIWRERAVIQATRTVRASDLMRATTWSPLKLISRL